MKKASAIQKKFDIKIENAEFVAVCSTLDPIKALEIAERLLSKGINAMEIAYRNPSAIEKTDLCIKTVRKAFPAMLLGAATVINAKLARRAVKAGAQFILSPGYNPSTVAYCVWLSIPVYPGVATPSEIEAALEWNLTTLKFFPAEAMGGIAFLKSLAGPFPQVKFIVSGGLDAENQAEYRNLKNVAAVSGSWLSDFER